MAAISKSISADSLAKLTALSDRMKNAADKNAANIRRMHNLAAARTVSVKR